MSVTLSMELTTTCNQIMGRHTELAIGVRNIEGYMEVQELRQLKETTYPIVGSVRAIEEASLVSNQISIQGKVGSQNTRMALTPTQPGCRELTPTLSASPIASSQQQHGSAQVEGGDVWFEGEGILR